MSDTHRRLSRLGGNKTSLSLQKTTPNISAVRSKGSLKGKVDLLPAVPTDLKDKKRKSVLDHGKLKKPPKARVSFVPPVEFRHQKQKNTTVAVMPISRQTPAQLQQSEETGKEGMIKLDTDFQYPPLQLPFKSPAFSQSPLLSALSPRLPALAAPNNLWLDFALDGSQLFRAPMPVLPYMARDSRGQLVLTENEHKMSRLSKEPLMMGYASEQSPSATNEHLTPSIDNEPPLLCPLLESCSSLVPPLVPKQQTAPSPAQRQGYIKQENGLAKLLFRSDTSDSDSQNSSLMFIQLPTSLPITIPPLLPASKPTTDKQVLAHKLDELDKSSINENSLKRIPPGFLGNITLYKSGKMTLQLGGVALNAEPGARKTFREEILSVSPESGDCFPLGSVSNRVVFSLDVDGVT